MGHSLADTGRGRGEGKVHQHSQAVGEALCGWGGTVGWQEGELRARGGLGPGRDPAPPLPRPVTGSAASERVAPVAG